MLFKESNKMGCDTEVCNEILNALSSEGIGGAMIGGILGVLIGFGILIALFVLVIVYIYNAFAWYTIGRKLKYKNSWLAWIPIARWAMVLQMGKFHWAWIFLILIPVLGWIALAVLLIISTWRVYDNRKYSGWLSLAIIIPEVGGLLYLIIIGFVAWKDKEKGKSMKKIKVKIAKK